MLYIQMEVWLQVHLTFRAWKCCAPIDFMFVPALWAGEQDLSFYEARVIKELQAPTQQHAHRVTDLHTRKMRMFPPFCKKL